VVNDSVLDYYLDDDGYLIDEKGMPILDDKG